MKRLIEKAAALLLCIVLLLSSVVSASAIMPLPLKVGDVDRDNNITVVDATLIQRFLIKMPEPNELQAALSDTDGDGVLSVIDATALQRQLSGLSGPFVSAEITDYVVGFTSFHSNSEIAIADHYSTQEIAYVGVPVTFYPKAYGGPRRYTLSVDGEIVYAVEAKAYHEKDGIAYTFTEEGDYIVSCDAECNYGQHTQSSHRIKVVRLPESGDPVVMGAVFFDQDYRSSGDSVLTVIASGGTAPYQYNYTLYYDGLSPLCAALEPEGEVIPAVDDGSYTTGYIDSNVINLYELFAKYVKKPSEMGKSDVMRVTITVRDANGRVSQPAYASYIGYEICY